MHLKLSLFWGVFGIFKFYIPGCSLSSQLPCEIDSTNGFLTSSSFRQVLFQILISGLTLVSVLENESGFEIGTQLVITGMQSSSPL
jgi:hypothetical protein